MPDRTPAPGAARPTEVTDLESYELLREDAARFRWLAEQNWHVTFAADMGGDESVTALMCEMPRLARFGFDLRKNIDDARSLAAPIREE